MDLTGWQFIAYLIVLGIYVIYSYLDYKWVENTFFLQLKLIIITLILVSYFNSYFLFYKFGLPLVFYYMIAEIINIILALDSEYKQIIRKSAKAIIGKTLQSKKKDKKITPNDKNPQDEEAAIKVPTNDDIERMLCSDIPLDDIRYDFLGYANKSKEIVKKIEEYSTKDSLVAGRSSLSIKIDGEWGTGKSTLMEFIKQRLEKMNYKTFSFNPWKIADERNCLDIFYNRIVDNMGSEGLLLQKAKNKYIRKVFDSCQNNFIDVFRLGYSQKTSEDYFEEFKEQLKTDKTKLVIFIDDLDRLQYSELINTLKLIRMFSDVTNIIFITAIDTAAAVAMLKRNSIQNPEVYLDKFFNYPVPLCKLSTEFIVRRIIPKGENTEIQKLDSIMKGQLSIRELKLFYLYMRFNPYQEAYNITEFEYITIILLKLFYRTELHEILRSKTIESYNYVGVKAAGKEYQYYTFRYSTYDKLPENNSLKTSKHLLVIDILKMLFSQAGSSSAVSYQPMNYNTDSPSYGNTIKCTKNQSQFYQLIEYY